MAFGLVRTSEMMPSDEGSKSVSVENRVLFSFLQGAEQFKKVHMRARNWFRAKALRSVYLPHRPCPVGDLAAINICDLLQG